MTSLENKIPADVIIYLFFPINYPYLLHFNLPHYFTIATINKEIF
jgi:hypothetical protein